MVTGTEATMVRGQMWYPTIIAGDEMLSGSTVVQSSKFREGRRCQKGDTLPRKCTMPQSKRRRSSLHSSLLIQPVRNTIRILLLRIKAT
eukprot:scaffold5048_cov81-Skeletonema_dohrnii-CCMP3373.AAC.1